MKKRGKKFPSIITAIIIIVITIISTSSSIYNDDVISQLLILIPSFLIVMGFSVSINFFIPTRAIRILTRMGTIFFLFYFLFYFSDENWSRTNSVFISVVFLGPIFITTFMFKNRVLTKEGKESLKIHSFEIDTPLKTDKHGNMAMKRNEKFITNGFFEVIFVNKNYQKIDGPFDQIEAEPRYPRRIKKKGKFGFINKDHEVIIEPRFDTASYFYKEISIVRIENETFQINKRGEIISNS